MKHYAVQVMFQITAKDAESALHGVRDAIQVGIDAIETGDVEVKEGWNKNDAVDILITAHYDEPTDITE